MTSPNSVLHIIRRDHASFALLTFVGLLWVVLLLLLVAAAALNLRLDGDDGAVVWILASIMLAATLVCGSLVVRRVTGIRRALASGLTVIGKIIGVGFNSEDVGSVLFEYRYAGKAYTARHATGDATATKRFEGRTEVAVAVDPENPARSYLLELFAGTQPASDAADRRP